MCDQSFLQSEGAEDTSKEITFWKCTFKYQTKCAQCLTPLHLLHEVTATIHYQIPSTLLGSWSIGASIYYFHKEGNLPHHPASFLNKQAQKNYIVSQGHSTWTGKLWTSNKSRLGFHVHSLVHKALKGKWLTLYNSHPTEGFTYSSPSCAVLPFITTGLC